MASADFAAGAGTQRPATIGIAYQIPRDTLALLMIAQVVVVLPYLRQLSPWIVAVGLFCGMWRSNVYQGRWDYPKRWVKGLLVVACVAAVTLTGVSVFSLEAAASLLVAAFALKLIEMKSRRDAYVVIFLAYFVIATQFLFDQSMLVALYQLGALVMVTAAMISLNQLHSRVRPLASLKLASSLVLQALPLTLVVFLLFPRVAPLWSVPLPGSSMTGLSDTVKPGDVASLTQSDALVFRAVVDGPVPPPSQLYWRGLVYSKYDAGAWSAIPGRPGREDTGPAAMQGRAGGLDYEVMLEPTNRTWLYALENSTSPDAGIVHTTDGRLVANDAVLSVFRYRATRWPPTGAVEPLSTKQRALETTVDRHNPRLLALAAELSARHPEADALVAAILGRIRTEPYHYTLQPPRYQGADSIDQFWFDGRAGFCEHYASALAYLLRAAGIPAHLVGGYQGGELNPITGHLIVRQYDAHAWVEYFTPERGWQRVDPTAAVAPERVERGLSAALNEEDLASLSILSSARLASWDLAAGLLRWADSIEHRWNLWVVGYDNRFQEQFLTGLLGGLSAARVALAVLVGGGLTLGCVALVLFWRRRPVNRHPVERAFRHFSDRLADYGYERRPDESPAGFVRRIAGEVGLAEAQVGGLVAELDTLLYNPAVAWGPRELRGLRSQLRRLQFRLAFGSAR